MITPEQRHRHTGLGGDGEQIDYNSLVNKPSSGQPKMFYGGCSSGVPIILTVGFNISCVMCTLYGSYPAYEYFSTGMGRLNTDGSVYQECVYSVNYVSGVATAWSKAAQLGVTVGTLTLNSIVGGTLTMTPSFGIGSMSYSIIIY